jgi:esterase/lipase
MKYSCAIGIIILFSSIFLHGCIQSQTQQNSNNSSKKIDNFDGVTNMDLKTSDGKKIAATYYKSQQETRNSIILLHMLARNRNDWNEFAKKLQAKYDVIAIDFRGHGDSDGDLNTFGTLDFQKFLLDVKAAANYLDSKGKKIYAIIGGSIGANEALIYGADNNVERLVLLSPGLDYRGVKTEESVRKFTGKVLFCASEDDSYSASSTRKLYDITLAKKELKIYQNAGHGTRMFASTDLEELIMNWLGK